mmetsp:Transcript_2239/g.3017  ORF Transcript_2239/g.3017 Transcript_2239/m.3017 type:complete len:952 (-) Transcript_2239:232-3087(-)|eukprot:CAMPEP_0175093788 /NCGR_PEP_ID=MMETSP0086_2-20121207/3218_1 /TAXON_ID=136419 /ORGANISM="Unknown Unknown, Strain D1" /LENGTH=951 /DNA_ID=CAMNT_0016366811 /DNA_START=17 /DNA_END=2872 /DNA_ORIENTATION=+
MILSRSSVVGIDLGNEKTVVCMARNQKLEVITNAEGGRKSATAVAFKNQKRLVGDAAMVEINSNPRNTLAYFQRFLGLNKDDPSLGKELPHVGFAIEQMADGMAGIVVDYDGQKQVLNPVQVIAMFLADLKKNVESTMGGQSFEDCVIACPPYWGNRERELAISAAKVAGLNVVRLMNDTSAVSAQYGLLRPLPKKPIHVLFVDVGACSSKICISKFQEGEVHCVSSSAAKYVGGRDFDVVVRDIMVEQIKATAKMDPTTNPKAMRKLLKAAERVKKVLSANKSAPYNLECLMDDKDAKGVVERSAFDAGCAALLAQLAGPVQQALDGAKLTASDLHSVEVVGGASRIPCLQAALKDLLGKDCGFTCDIYESVAKGAALQCALLSPSMKTKQFDLIDHTPYTLKLLWEKSPGTGQADQVSASDMESAVVFKQFSKIGKTSVKEITYKGYKRPFDLAVEYEGVSNYPQLNHCYSLDPTICRVQTRGMEAHQEEGYVPPIKVRVVVDVHGIVSVSSAALLKTVKKEEEPPKEEEKPKQEAKADDTKQDEAEAKQSGEEASEGNDKQGDGANPPAEKDEKKTDEAKEEPKKEKAKVKRVELEVACSRTSKLDQAAIEAFQAVENKMVEMDNTITRCVGVRNDLEAYILDMQAELDHSLKPFLLDSEGESLRSSLMGAEDWLYDQDEEELGWQTAEKTFLAKLQELKKLGDPIKSRKQSFAARQDAVENFEDCVSRIKSSCGQPLIFEAPVEKEVEETETKDDKPESAKEEAETKQEPEKEAEPSCDVCGKTSADTGKPLMKCTKCQKIGVLVRYCSRDCQKAAWKEHKKVCGKEKTAPTVAAPKPAQVDISRAKELAKSAPEDESKRQQLMADVAEAQEWLSKLRKKQQDTKLDEPPQFEAESVTKKIAELTNKEASVISALKKYGETTKESISENKDVPKDQEQPAEEMLSLK